MNLVDLFDLVVTKSGYKDYILNEEEGDERWDNIMELRTVAEEYRELSPPEGLSSFLEGSSPGIRCGCFERISRIK